jgi:flagellar export protein FliJ
LRKFRLRKVLEWKESLEKEARAERLAAEERANTLREMATAARERRERVPACLTDGDVPVNVEDLAEWSDFAEQMRRREEKLTERLDEFRPTLEERVRSHVRLRQDVEGLRRLQEKEAERRRKQGEKRAQEALDDAASRTKLPGPGSEFPQDESKTNPSPTTENPVDTRPPGRSGPSRGGGS